MERGTGWPIGRGDQDQKVREPSLSLSLSVYNIDSTKNGLYLGIFFHCLFFVFVNTPAVADNHHFLHEAYVSDDLVRAIHRFMKRYPKGIPVTDFTNKFEV